MTPQLLCWVLILNAHTPLDPRRGQWIMVPLRNRAESFSFSRSDVSQESCRLIGSWFMLQTSIFHRACYSLQPWVSGQKTSPCIRTRWPCIPKTLSKFCNLTFVCWYVLALLEEVLMVAWSNVGCSLACICWTHSLSGSLCNLGITNMILKGWHVKCCRLIRISSFCTVKCTLDDCVVVVVVVAW